MSGILKAYQKTLRNHPIVVQSIQVGVLMGLGDFIAQKFVDKKHDTQSFDFVRNRNFILLGTFIVGPASSKWYLLLDQYIKGKHEIRVLKKVACDQFIFAPFFLIFFLVLLESLEKKSKSEVQKTVRTIYPDILKANYSVWPWVQLCNFYLIPLHYQTLFVQSFALAWNIYISYKTHIN